MPIGRPIDRRTGVPRRGPDFFNAPDMVDSAMVSEIKKNTQPNKTGMKFGDALKQAVIEGQDTFQWGGKLYKAAYKDKAYENRLRGKEKQERPLTNEIPKQEKVTQDPTVMNTYDSPKPINTYSQPNPYAGDIMNTYDSNAPRGMEWDGVMPLPPTMQNRPGQREFSNNLAEDLVKAMALQVGTMGLGAGINAITAGSKGMINAYQVANTSRKGLAPGMKALGYEQESMNLIPAGEKVLQHILSAQKNFRNLVK